MNINNPQLYLPDYLILDLTNELKGIRDLQTMRIPDIPEQDIMKIIIKLMSVVSDISDIEYQACDFVYSLELHYFRCNTSGVRITYQDDGEKIRESIFSSIRMVCDKLKSMGAYVGTRFPYECKEVHFLSRVVMRKSREDAFYFTK